MGIVHVHCVGVGPECDPPEGLRQLLTGAGERYAMGPPPCARLDERIGIYPGGWG